MAIDKISIIYTERKWLDGAMESSDPRHITNVARRLKQLRAAMGFQGRKQSRFAQAMGLTPGLYNHYETASRPITLTSAQRIADRCGIPLDWIISGKRDGLSVQWLNLLPDLRQDQNEQVG